MRRLLHSVVTIALAGWLALPLQAIGGPRYGLKFADNTTNAVSFAPVYGAFDTIPQLTVALWATFSSVANASRNIVGTVGGTNAGFSIFRRVADGTQVRAQFFRVTTGQVVDTDAGALSVTTVPVCLIFAFDVNGAPKAFRGTRVTPMADVSTGVINGTGARGTAVTSYALGNATGGFTAAGMTVYELQFFQTQFTLAQAQQWRIKETAGLPALPLHTWHPGKDGTTGVYDESGNGAHGIITGAVMDGTPMLFPFLEGFPK